MPIRRMMMIFYMFWIFGICENDAKRSCFVLLQCFNTCWKFSIEPVVLCCTVRSARYYSVVLVYVQARSAHTNVHAGVKEYCLFPLQQNMGDCTLLTDYFFAQKMYIPANIQKRLCGLVRSHQKGGRLQLCAPLSRRRRCHTPAAIYHS